MYQPLVIASDNWIAAPAIFAKDMSPAVIYVEESKIEGFYRAGDRYYVHLCGLKDLGWLELEEIKTVTELRNAVKVDVISVKDTSGVGNLIEGAIMRITAPLVPQWNYVVVRNSLELRFKGGLVRIPATDLYEFFKFVSAGFPRCVEVFARDLVHDEATASKAAEICAKVFGSVMKSCNSVQSLIATVVCTFIASRMCSYPLAMEEIVYRYNIPKPVVRKMYKYIMEKMGISSSSITFNAHAYIRDVVSRLIKDPEEAQKVAEEAIKLYDLAKRYNITSGKIPEGIAAAAIYIVANKDKPRVSQRELTAVTYVTEVTIRNRAKELKRLLKKLQNSKGGEKHEI